MFCSDEPTMFPGLLRILFHSTSTMEPYDAVTTLGIGSIAINKIDTVSTFMELIFSSAKILHRLFLFLWM